MKRSFLIAAAFVLTSCASSVPYGTSEMLTENKAIVTVGGNVLVPRIEIERHANVLAAQSTIEAGFSHFIFEDKEVFSRSFDGGARRYDLDGTVIMFSEENAPVSATNASEVLKRATGN